MSEAKIHLDKGYRPKLVDVASEKVRKYISHWGLGGAGYPMPSYDIDKKQAIWLPEKNIEHQDLPVIALSCQNNQDPVPFNNCWYVGVIARNHLELGGLPINSAEYLRSAEEILQRTEFGPSSLFDCVGLLQVMSPIT